PHERVPGGAGDRRGGPTLTGPRRRTRSGSTRWSASCATGSGRTMPELSSIEFAWPWAFAALPLPLLVWLLLPAYREQRASVQIPFFARVAEATGQTPQRGASVLPRLPLQMIVACIGWVLLVTALARPQFVGDPITHDISARDIMLAIDISGSMNQADFETADKQMLQRLDGVKPVVGDFIARR